MNEQNWVEGVARSLYMTPMDRLTALILLKDFLSQAIDAELDLRNEESDDHEQG